MQSVLEQELGNEILAPLNLMATLPLASKGPGLSPLLGGSIPDSATGFLGDLGQVT